MRKFLEKLKTVFLIFIVVAVTMGGLATITGDIESKMSHTGETNYDNVEVEPKEVKYIEPSDFLGEVVEIPVEDYDESLTIVENVIQYKENNSDEISGNDYKWVKNYVDSHPYLKEPVKQMLTDGYVSEDEYEVIIDIITAKREEKGRETLGDMRDELKELFK